MPKWLDRLLGKGKPPSQLDRVETAIAKLDWRMQMADQALHEAVVRVTAALDRLSEEVARQRGGD